MADYHKVPKLKGIDNFKQWEVSLRSSLVINKVARYIDPAYTPVTRPKPEPMDTEEYFKQIEKEDEALAGIHISCAEGPYALIEGITTAQATYDKLKRQYGTDTYASMEEAYFALHDLKASSFKDLHEYLAEFRKLTNKLDRMKHPVDNAQQAAIFKRGLPEHLGPYLFTMYDRCRDREEDIDLEGVTIALIANDRSNKADNSKAFAGNFGKQAKGKQSNNNNNQSRNSGHKCTTCGGAHLTDRCFHGHPELAPNHFKSLSKEQLAQRAAERKKNRNNTDDNTSKQPSRQQSKQNLDDNDQSKSKSYTARFNNQADQDSNEVIVDSGDQEHTNWDRSRFVSYIPIKNHTVSGIGNQSYNVKGVGTVVIPAIIDGKIEPFELKNVRHVPDVKVNLLSTTQLDLGGYHHKGGDGQKVFCNKDGKVVLQAYLRDRTYYLDTMWNQSRSLRLKSSEPAKNNASWTTWHKRFGHISMEATKAMARDTGVDTEAADRLQKAEPHELCEACVSGKITRIPSRQPMRRSSTVGQAWHVDLASASRVVTLGGHTNIMTLTDEASGFTRLVHMASRAELPQRLEEEIKHINNQGVTIAFIRSDNELAWGNECKRIYKQYGIRLTPSAPYNPSQNGIAERKNRTLFTRVRAVLIDSGLPQTFWGEAVYYINYTENLRPNKEGRSPFELWFGHKPATAYLKPFGCWCYSFDTAPNKKKLDSRAIKGRFLGHEGKSIYRVWNIQKQRTIRSAHVIFDEKAPMSPYPDDDLQYEEAEEDQDSQHIQELFDTIDDPTVDRRTTQEEADTCRSKGVSTPEANSSEGEQRPESPTVNSRPESPTSHVSEPPSPLLSPVSAPVAPRRSGRSTNKVDYKEANSRGIPSKNNSNGFRALLTRLTVDEIPIPASMKEALNGPQSNNWLEAGRTEIANHMKQNTWNKPCTPPKGVKVIPGRWVLALKYGPMGEVVKWKARWVVKGFHQREGIDFNETFSATLKATSWRILIALAAKYDLHIESSDVVAAFLESLVYEDIWVEQPHEFTDGNTKHACKLNKALYGLKQASYEWYETLWAALKSLGYERLEFDHCVFINHETGVIIPAYVDDLLFIAKSKEAIANIKAQLDKFFNFKHLGDLKDYLEQKHLPTPPDGYTAKPADIAAYQSIVGALNWLSIMTRPDITYVVSQLSRHLANPLPEHMEATKRVLRYLAGTPTYGLSYGPSSTSSKSEGLIGYTDASYCDDATTSRSTGAYIFKLFNGPIAWQSKLQKLVATSTAESEYVACFEAAREAVFLGPMIAQGLGYAEGNAPVMILMDNQAAVRLATNPTNHKATKHIRMRYHFLRQVAAETKEICLKWVDTKGQAADLLTKAIGPNAFAPARDLLGLAPSKL